jgi:c(7)-type cytochrome triheme protein
MRPFLFFMGLLFGFAAYGQTGRAVYEKSCALCHASGVAGAPKFGNAADWVPRRSRGTGALYASALNGTPKGMPPRGGNAELKDAEVKAAVDHMLAAVAASPSAKPADSAKPAAKAAEPAKPVAKPAATPPAPPAPVAAVKPAPQVNAFNRLLRPQSRRNPPPAEDGIHDPKNDGTHALQAPLSAYEGFPRANSGNRVDWGGALTQKRITPRWDRNDPKAAGLVVDLNIVREVKGSMPDVVYPHKQHTEWLDCSNCHPAIFIPQKGANQISMAAILLGEKCGVCHGKVAFPVSECRLCHSKKKDVAASPPSMGATK